MFSSSYSNFLLSICLIFSSLNILPNSSLFIPIQNITNATDAGNSTSGIDGVFNSKTQNLQPENETSFDGQFKENISLTNTFAPETTQSSGQNVTNLTENNVQAEINQLGNIRNVSENGNQSVATAISSINATFGNEFSTETSDISTTSVVSLNEPSTLKTQTDSQATEAFVQTPAFTNSMQTPTTIPTIPVQQPTEKNATTNGNDGNHRGEHHHGHHGHHGHHHRCRKCKPKSTESGSESQEEKRSKGHRSGHRKSHSSEKLRRP